MVPGYSDKLLYDIPLCKQAIIINVSLTKYMHQLKRLGMSYSAVGHDFKVNESTIYIKYAYIFIDI